MWDWRRGDDVPKMTVTVVLTAAQYAMLQQAAVGAGLLDAEALVAKVVGDRLGTLYRERAADAMQKKVETDVAALAAGVVVSTEGKA